MTKPLRQKARRGGGIAQRAPVPSRARKASPVEENQSPGLVVGIGASAGGLQAFKTFFAGMPADSGMAFVLVQHLAPQHTSLLAELVGSTTTMPVVEATNGMTAQANRVHVIPPNATLTIKAGKLRVARPAPERPLRRPVDSFLSSLAEDQEDKAVAIILAGGGSDGAEGIRTIKEHGGFTMAQSEFDSHAMPGMPMSAAATGLVDQVLGIEEMPAKLIAYGEHLTIVAPHKGLDGTREDAAEHLAGVCALLRTMLGHDFSHYKEKTILRRIQRRMQVLQIGSTPDYIGRLGKDRREAELLFRELLIGVTHFFRDPAAFAALNARVIHKLFRDKQADDAVRVWVPGCATGQEAYSIAILLQEAAEEMKVEPKIQIFATDIDDRAISVARLGRYSAAQLAGVSAERLKRWFVADGDHFRVVKTIREACVFSTHSVTKDPPFSRLDLLSCRNLMIYFDTVLQDRLIRTFHYALRPGGYLLLGMSENVTRYPKLLQALDSKHRIFERRKGPASLPVSSMTPVVIPAADHAAIKSESSIEKSARRLMERHVPAYVVIDNHHEVLRFFGETDKYLGPAPGAASLDLFSLLRRGLRPAARSVLAKAWATGGPVTQVASITTADNAPLAVELVVEPISVGGTSAFVLAFLDHPSESKASGPAEPVPLAAMRDSLEGELRSTRERLLAAVDQLETANEEMKSANEEYQSLNEELQSTNEELETSKEEMQSINEELQTVNAELNSKNLALVHVNSDLKNFLDSTEIATLFVDNNLRIKSFTPGMTGLFHLREGDVGRPVTDIVSRLAYDGLRKDVSTVLQDLFVIERELAMDGGGRTFIMRLRPYRTIDNVVDGVVMTFFDITDRQRADDLRKHMMDELNHRVKNTLATVQSIAAQSFKGDDDTTNRRAFDARLIALSRTHNLLALDTWQGVSMRALLTQELEPYRSDDGKSPVIDGPDIDLNPKASLALGLCIHELTTNAAKCGALSRPGGEVRATWEIRGSGDSRVLRLAWAEAGGPPVKKPKHKGFGSRVIERGLSHELDGDVDFDFDPKGVLCTIELPFATISMDKANGNAG